jgi:hypothetical protein
LLGFGPIGVRTLIAFFGVHRRRDLGGRRQRGTLAALAVEPCLYAGAQTRKAVRFWELSENQAGTSLVHPA